MKALLLLIACFCALISMASAQPSIAVIESRPDGKGKQLGSVVATGEADRARILALWQDVKRKFPKDRRNLYGPDAGYVEIRITHGEEEIVVRSWHPLFEENEELVVTSKGVEALAGRSREEVLKSDVAWYREARATFDRIVKFVETDLARPRE